LDSLGLALTGFDWVQDGFIDMNWPSVSPRADFAWAIDPGRYPRRSACDRTKAGRDGAGVHGERRTGTVEHFQDRDLIVS